MMSINRIVVFLIGPYPPPYGGISVHIQRLSEQLIRKNIKCIVCVSDKNVREGSSTIITDNSVKLFLSQLLSHRKDIIHCHVFNPIIISILSILTIVTRKGIIITLHSFRYDMNLINKFTFWISRWARINFIAVGPEIENIIISLGIKPECVEVIPSFIPPSIKEVEITEIPPETWDFINNHNPVISANAFRISFYNNQDLYGIDMCINLCANLKRDYPKIGFVFCLPDVGDYEYFSKMKQRIKESGIEENFFFQTKPCQFYPILMKSNVFVRPTNTDGYGVSIAEAIYFKVPSIASNVCPRPEGTIIFKSRDIDDFILKVKDVLDNYEEHKKRLESVILEDNAEKIIKIYQNLCK